MGISTGDKPCVEVITDQIQIQEIKRNHKCVPTTAVREYKKKPEGIVPKTRICGIGTQTHDPRDVETSSPVLSREMLRIILILSLSLSWLVSIFDISQAYTQADKLQESETIYLLPPVDASGCETWCRHHLWRMVRPLYGIKDSGLKWWRTLDSYLRLSGGMTNNTYDPSLYWIRHA